ncbi:MAG: hypothetical protein ACR2H0_08065 [Candidatus Limnocylindrales bacterium]
MARASRFVEFECVALTKIEIARDLLACADALGSHHVAYRSIVPIVETSKGLNNLDEIMGAARRAGIQ